MTWNPNVMVQGGGFSGLEFPAEHSSGLLLGVEPSSEDGPWLGLGTESRASVAEPTGAHSPAAYADPDTGVSATTAQLPPNEPGPYPPTYCFRSYCICCGRGGEYITRERKPVQGATRCTHCNGRMIVEFETMAS